MLKNWNSCTWLGMYNGEHYGKLILKKIIEVPYDPASYFRIYLKEF